MALGRVGAAAVPRPEDDCVKLALPTLQSLRARWLAVEVAGLALGLLGLGWAQQTYSRSVVVSEVARGGLAVGGTIRELLESRGREHMPEIRELLLHVRGGVTGVKAIFIVDEHGTIVAHSDPARIGARANEPEIDEAIRSGLDSVKEYSAGIDPGDPDAGPQSEHLHLTLPIHGDYDPVRRSAITGAVVLAVDIASAGARIAREYRIMAGMLIALLVLFVVAQFLALRDGYRRLVRLGRAATAFGKGHYGLRVDTGGPIEFQQLERAFNEMAERVQVTDAELRVAKKKAEAAAEAKSRFLANMSHEIRTPLTGIIGYSDLALEDPTMSEQTRHQIKQVYSASNSLRAIIDDILDLAKIESGKINIVSETISLREIVDNCAEMAEPMATVKGLTLRKTFDNAIPAWVIGDGVRIQQVVLNLLNNAIKFTESGSVELAAALEGRPDGRAVVRFIVRDTGIGIAQDKIPELFQRFQQADETITRRFGGTGLGLAISKALVTLMHGEIGVDSTPGKGSTFWFRLALPVAAGPPELQADVAPDAGGRALKILVVDDSEMNAELAQTLLRRLGHHVDKVFDGQSALRACAKERYDLVFMDIQMPFMDGMEATRHIRALDEHNKQMSIVAMTANVLPEQVAQYRVAGMSDHLAKPIDRDRLRAILAHVMKTGQAPPAPRAADKPLFDRAVFDDVRAMLGAEKVRRYLGGLSEALAGDWSAGGERASLMQRAHKIISTAGQLGFMELSTAAYELETAIRRDGDVDGTLAAFNEARALAAPVLLRLVAEQGQAERPAAGAGHDKASIGTP
jgi:signal transduction histidine kinase/CheY-like chemotaxis protein